MSATSDRVPRLEILRAENHHAEELAEFIRKVWSPDATAESVLAARAAGARHNVAEPGVPPPTWIALQAGRVLGYVTTIPIRLWDGHRDWAAYWIKGLMVHPEFRSGPIGYHVLKAAAQALPRSAGLAVAPAARRLFAALGYTDCGAIQNWLRPLRPGRIIQRVDVAALGLTLPSWKRQAIAVARSTGIGAFAGVMAGWSLLLAASIRRGSGAALQHETLDPVGQRAELEALWQVCRNSIHPAVVRDPAYLVPRYPVEPEGTYHWIGVRRGRTLVGLAVLRTPRATSDERLKGLRIATLSDLLYDPSDVDAASALLGAVERDAAALDADAIVASSSAPAATRDFRRQYYFPIGESIHLLLRATGESATVFSASVSDWWLQRGDGGSDDAL